MTAKEVARIINSKNWIFEIRIPDEGKCFGKKTVTEALADAESLERYFENIAKRNKATQLIVNTFTRNGTSYKQKDMYSISFDQAVPVVANEQQQATPANNGQTTLFKQERHNDGLGNVDESPAYKSNQGHPDRLRTSAREPRLRPSHFYDYDHERPSKHPGKSAEVLEVRLEFAQRDAQQYKERADRAEKQLEKLQEENTRLLREAAIKDDRHEIEKQKAISESKGGLAGVLEEAKNLPPELYDIIKTLLIKNGTQNALPPSYHSDSDAHNCIAGMLENLKGQSPEVVGMICLTAARMKESPKDLKAIYAHVHSSYERDNRKSSGAEESQERQAEQEPAQQISKNSDI